MNVDSRIVTALLLLGIGGALVAVPGGTVVAHVQEGAMAEPVDATVVAADVQRSSCSADASCIWRYTPQIEYEYTYEGRTYRSERVFSAGDVPTSEARAERIVAAHQPNSTVTAHVLPDSPARSYLVTSNLPLASGAFALLGLVMTLGGVGGTINMLRGKERADAGFD